ncbi:MAG: DUF2207 domain-containing protein, partial [Armatimonadetes bacterium]|nr:DUF2207 domain-containing protein [Armatimonadota bacterium]
MKSGRVLSLLVVVLGLFVLVSTAAARELYWERVDVKIEILPSGDLDVTEVQEYVFDGAWNGGFRDLYLSGCDGYRDIKVFEGDQEYRFGSVAEKGGFIIERHGRTLRVKWRSRNVDDPPYENQHVTFTLRYKAIGAVDYKGAKDELYWKPIFPDRDSAIKHATVTVVLPAAFQPGEIDKEIFGYQLPEEPASSEPTNIWTFSAEDVDPGDDLEFRISWPAGAIHRSLLHQIRRIFNERLFIPLWLFSVIAALVLMIITWARGGAEPDMGHIADYLPEPPSDLKPAEVGCLMSQGSAGIREVLATILDLARRGVIKMRKYGKAKDDIEFVLERTDEPLTPFEREVIQGLRLYELGATTKLKDLRDRFYTTVSKVAGILHEDMNSRQVWEEDPTTVRLRWVGYAFVAALGFAAWLLDINGLFATLPLRAGAGAVALAIGIPALIYSLRSKGARVMTFFGLGLVLFGLGVNPGSLLNNYHIGGTIAGSIIIWLIVAIVGYFMPRFSRSGAEERAKWEAFKRYLASLRQYGDVGQAASALEKYLPYAVAFGIQHEA